MGEGSGHRTQGQRVLTAVDVEERLDALDRDMETVLDELDALGEAAARAKHRYEIDYAKAILKAGAAPGNGKDGRTTVDEREAMARRDTDAVWLTHLIAEAHYDAAKRKLNVMQTRSDQLRTIAANIRAQTT